MEEVLKNAPRKKNGTLAVNRVQHLVFMGTAYGFKFYELCAVNETDNVVIIESSYIKSVSYFRYNSIHPIRPSFKSIE